MSNLLSMLSKLLTNLLSILPILPISAKYSLKKLHRSGLIQLFHKLVAGRYGVKFSFKFAT